jgi:hypothetical protein
VAAALPAIPTDERREVRRGAGLLFVGQALPQWLLTSFHPRGKHSKLPARRNVHDQSSLNRKPKETTMTRSAILLGVVALLSVLAGPASAQHVIYNPGWCAQFYPNANCQNYGPGNPYTSYGWRRAYGYHPRYHRGHRHYRHSY